MDLIFAVILACTSCHIYLLVSRFVLLSSLFYGIYRNVFSNLTPVLAVMHTFHFSKIWTSTYYIK